MDRSDVESILTSGLDPEQARLRIDALLEVERLELERTRAAEDDARHRREARRWFAPLLVTAIVGAASLAGDFILSGFQRRHANALQQQQANSDLIVSALADNVEQSVRNIEFLIGANLIKDVDQRIIRAAATYGPAASSAAGAVVPRRFEQPIFATARVASVSDGDSIRIDVTSLTITNVSFGQSYSFAGTDVNARGTAVIQLAWVDAAELNLPGCDAMDASFHFLLGQEAADLASTFLGWSEADPPVINVALLGLDPYGRLLGMVAPENGSHRNVEDLFAASLDRHLLEAGLAAPRLDGSVPPALLDDVVDTNSVAEANGVGLYADMPLRLDFYAPPNTEAEPWFVRRYCAVLAAEARDPVAVMRAGIDAQGLLLDRATGNSLDFGDILMEDDLVLTQKRLMRDVMIPSDPSN